VLSALLLVQHLEPTHCLFVIICFTCRVHTLLRWRAQHRKCSLYHTINSKFEFETCVGCSLIRMSTAS